MVRSMVRPNHWYGDLRKPLQRKANHWFGPNQEAHSEPSFGGTFRSPDGTQGWFGMKALFDEPWRVRAECLDSDPSVFFPEPGAAQKPAFAVCGRCPVRQECLEYAVDNGLWDGIWGGLNPGGRKRWARQRRLTAHQSV